MCDFIVLQVIKVRNENYEHDSNPNFVESSQSLIAVGDEVCALLCVCRRDLSAVGEEADEAAAQEAEPADEVPAEGPLELGEATVKAVSSIQRGSG